MAGINKVILIGRLGKDPDTRTLDNGNTVANFSLAVSESYKDKTTGQKKETTEWINVVMWRGLADLAAKYLHKGDQVYIEGKLRTRSWEKDGVTRYVTEVVGDSMTMLGKGSQKPAATPAVEHATGIPASPTHSSDTDDLPF